MGKFEYRHTEYDEEDDWHQIDAYDHESAARAAAERMDSDDSEMFIDPSHHTAVVAVRLVGDRLVRTYSISFDYHKCFYARRCSTPDTPSDKSEGST